MWKNNQNQTSLYSCLSLGPPPCVYAFSIPLLNTFLWPRRIRDKPAGLWTDYIVTYSLTYTSLLRRYSLGSSRNVTKVLLDIFLPLREKEKKNRRRSELTHVDYLRLSFPTLLPHLNYCSETWHFCNKNSADKLEMVRKRALCFVFRDKSSPCEELCKRIGLSSLREQRLAKILYWPGMQDHQAYVFL